MGGEEAQFLIQECLSLPAILSVAVFCSPRPSVLQSVLRRVVSGIDTSTSLVAVNAPLKDARFDLIISETTDDLRECRLVLDEKAVDMRFLKLDV